MQKAMRKAAVVLSGCGVYDGRNCLNARQFSKQRILIRLFRSKQRLARCHQHDEWREDGRKVIAPISFSNLKQAKYNDRIFSNIKRKNQRYQITLSEQISCKLAQYNGFKLQALLIPGGFGCAKNLSTFAADGDKLTVDEGVAKALLSFHLQKKPIALSCIAPIVAAKVFEGKGVKLTLGDKGDCWPYQGTIDVAQKLGNKIDLKGVLDVSIDQQNLVLTTPAYMKGDAKANQVFEGIAKMVERLSEMC